MVTEYLFCSLYLKVKVFSPMTHKNALDRKQSQENDFMKV